MYQKFKDEIIKYEMDRKFQMILVTRISEVL